MAGSAQAAEQNDGGSVTGLRRWVLTYPVLTIIIGSVLLRLGDLILFAVVAARDGVSVPRLLRAWDGEWYYRAITEGWPAALTQNPAGGVEPSTWAWPPVFPGLVKVLAAPLGRDAISPTMIAINLAASIAAAVLLWAALRPTAGNPLAVLTALLWASMPAAPVFVMAYAEGPFMLLLFLAILLAGRGHLAVSGAILVVAGLTKSSVAPYAIALIIVAILAMRAHRARVIQGSIAILLGLIAIALWPLIVATQLGSLTAYAQVQAPWSRSSVPGLDTLQLLWHAGTRPTEDPLMAVVLVIIALIAGVLVLGDRRFPLMVRLVGILSPLFLVTVGAGTSTARLLLPDLGLPAWLARITASSSARIAALVTVTLVLLLARYLWIAYYVSIAIAVPPP